MFETLQSTVMAITHNSKPLLLTTFLAILLMYFYALLGFSFIDDTFFFSPVQPAGENMCHTLVQCFTYVASLGPRSIGSVGDNLLRPSYGDNTEFRVRFYVRWLYEVSIFFIINVIFLKLILGIILDTFGGIDL